MSLPTWTPAALSSETVRFEKHGWRLVEAQHRVSTLKLVNTLPEQQILEDLIEVTKPAIPPECDHLHYLLATPFRYDAAYPTGSRFRRAGRTLGVFYAAETPETAIAEMAFFRLLFFAESPATPWPNQIAEYTAFSVSIATDRALDLMRPPFVAHHAVWKDPIHYGRCQDLADTAREADIALIRYESARDPDGGCNLAVLVCAAFAEPRPLERRTWRMRLGPSGYRRFANSQSKDWNLTAMLSLRIRALPRFIGNGNRFQIRLGEIDRQPRAYCSRAHLRI